MPGARLDTIMRGLAEDLRERGKLDLTEALIDGSHARVQGFEP